MSFFENFVHHVTEKILRAFDNMASAQYGCKTDVFFKSSQEFDIPDEGMYSDLEGFESRDLMRRKIPVS